MGSRGGDAPDGLRRRQLSTLFLRAPYVDWPALSQATKTEFRAPVRGMMAAADRYDAPTGVVLYAVSPASKARHEKLMVLSEHRTEPLMEISRNEVSLLREGFSTYDEFRLYWRRRTRRPYVPMAKVEVFTLRPLDERDQAWLGSRLFQRLYGDYL